MESTEHQEWRARQHLSIPAILKTALLVGAIFFVMSGGTPWTSAGAGNKILGRDFMAPFAVLLIGHFALSIIYTSAIAAVIYRMRLGGAVALGVATAMGLYVLNYAIYMGLGFKMQSPEFVVVFVHFVFGLFASLLYKAFSVPKKSAA